MCKFKFKRGKIKITSKIKKKAGEFLNTKDRESLLDFLKFIVIKEKDYDKQK